MYIVEPEKRTPVVDEVDVIVVGGGSAGVAAGVSAARNGANTILIERDGFFGGVSTAGCTGGFSNMLFDSEGNMVLKGIPLEVMRRLVKEGGTSHTWRDEHIIHPPKVPYDT